MALTKEDLDERSGFDVLKGQELHVRVLVLELGHVGRYEVPAHTNTDRAIGVAIPPGGAPTTACAAVV